MKTEDIKIGETYYVRVKVKTKGEDFIRVIPILQGGVLSTYWPTSFALGESSAFSPIIPENSVKNSEPAPKYAPCRKYREGDIVEPCQVNGRWCSHVWEDRSGIHYEVAKAEDPHTAHMELKDPDGPHSFSVHAAFFKLVTPVEEREPYEVTETTDYFAVAHRITDDEPATFWKESHPNPATAPKHDPCRLFRKGDKVKLVEWNGRKLWEDIPHLHRIYDENGTFTVRINELSGAKVAIIPDAYTECVYLACPACLELVTQVEELEPYEVTETTDYFAVAHRITDDEPATFWKESHPNPAAAAEAECKRLNDEYRKEKR